MESAMTTFVLLTVDSASFLRMRDRRVFELFAQHRAISMLVLETGRVRRSDLPKKEKTRAWTPKAVS